MAEAIDFKESNFTWRGPDGDDEVFDLPAWRGENHTVSCWRLSWRERLRALFCGTIYLHVIGNVHPPVLVDGSHPFEKVVAK